MRRMRVQAQITYPTASPQQVFDLVVDQKFRAAVCQATHALAYHIDVDRDASGGARVTVERTLPADVPDFIKKFVGQTITIVQTEVWGAQATDGTRTADLRIQLKDQPASMGGTLTLEAAGAGTRQQISGDLTVSVPFFGNRIEPEVAKAIVAAATKEQETGRAWLDRSV